METLTSAPSLVIWRDLLLMLSLGKKKKHMGCKGFMSSCFLCLDSCMRIGKRVLQEIIWGGLIIVDWCCGRNSGEDIDQQLVHCKGVSKLWSFALTTFGVSWNFPKVCDLLMGWRNCLGKHASNIWYLVPLCVMSIIWRV